MAYTRSWNDGTPAGSRAANQIDDSIREFKVDVHERMDSALVTDWSTDPVVVKDSVLGKVTGRVVVFGPHIMSARNPATDSVDKQDLYIGMNTTGLTIIGTPYLPHGVTITKMEAVMDRQTAANCVLEFFKTAYTTGAAKVTIDTATRAVAGIGVTAGATGVLAETVDSTTTLYGFKFTAAGFVGAGARLYAVRLTLNVPTSESAV